MSADARPKSLISGAFAQAESSKTLRKLTSFTPPKPNPPFIRNKPTAANCITAQAVYTVPMFTIEHDFDATVITLVDEGQTPLQEDVIVNNFAECITVEQYDARTDRVQKITLSITQMRDLAAAISLPEGAYSRGHHNK